MILTVTLNTAVDKTYTVENFRIDRVHRPSAWRIVAGGKGINVARVYIELGGQALATGFIGGHNGDFIIDSLRKEKISSDFVRTEGESRVAIKILDPVQKTETELNEVGPEIKPGEVERMRLKFESLVQGMEYVILSGSLPPGVPDAILAEMIDIARHYGVRCVVDSSGAALEAALSAVPFMAKPNASELSSIMGRELGTVEEAAEAALEYIERGTEIMVVTFGRDGAIAVTKQGVWRARPPEIEFVSAVGSGDSFAAGFVYAFASNPSVAEALKMGTAAGAANAQHFGAGFCSCQDVLSLSKQVEICEIE